MIDYFKKGLFVSFFCFAAVAMLFSVGFLSNLQNTLADNLYGGKPALSNIIIISIDDKSLQEIGRWPWDRKVFASVIEKLSSAEAVGLDVSFFEKSESDSDALLASAFSNTGNVVIPVEYSDFKITEGSVVPASVLLPIPAFRNATDQGYINIISDSDGVSRAINLDLKGEFDSFAVKIYKKYAPSGSFPDSSRFLINFIGPPNSFPHYSFSDILNGSYSADEFKDKIVLIGATAPDLHDASFVPTSEGAPVSGVEIHANILQTLITKNYLLHESYFSVIFSILLCSLIILFFVVKFSIRISSSVVLLLNIFYIVAAIIIFGYGIILNIIYVPLASIVCFSSLVSFFYILEQKEKKWISDAFSKYVAPEVVQQIIDNHEKLNLGGETRTITIFFSDIRGFTSISEALTAQQIVHLLNKYLTLMTDIVLDTKGVVDKYIGDAIMAFWGAPLDQPDHAFRAAHASLKMMNSLKEFQKICATEKLPHIDIGIGLNTGEAVIGNMGSYERFNYTAMGDTINLGSRLEGVNKQYGTNIVVSDATRDLIKSKYLTRKLDSITVKGKKIPITIYELVNSHEEASAGEKQFVKLFEQALRLYFKQNWDEASALFLEIKNKFKNKIKSCEVSCQLYLDRSAEFKKHPPGKDWDGVYNMKTK